MEIILGLMGDYTISAKSEIFMDSYKNAGATPDSLPPSRCITLLILTRFFDASRRASILTIAATIPTMDRVTL